MYYSLMFVVTNTTLAMKRIIALHTSVLIALCFTSNLNAQSVSPPFQKEYTLYINQPIGFLSKVRLTLECKIQPKISILYNITGFYGFTPGLHGYVEWRKYIRQKEKTELAVYALIGAGQSAGAVGFYAIAGGGIGQKIYLDKQKRFSLYCMQGLKFCPNIIGQHANGDSGFFHSPELFYVTGPAAVLDLKFNFGYRF